MKISYIAMGIAISMAASSAGFAASGAIKKIDFTPGKDFSLLVLSYSGEGAFRLFQNAEQRNVILEAENLELPAALTRSIDASAKDGPVMQVTPYNSGDGRHKMSKFVLQLRQNADAKKTELPGRLVVEIRRKSVLGKSEVRFDRRDEISTHEAANQKAEEVARKLIEVLDSPPNEKHYFGAEVTFEGTNIDVHDVFRLVGESSGLNIITDSDVSGKVNLALKDVPWDQLLDIVVQQSALKALITGNVIRITPLDKYNKEQEAKMKQIAIGAELEPVIMSVIPLSFAKAEEMSKMINALLVQKDGGNTDAIDKANTDAVNQANLTLAAQARGADGKNLQAISALPKISQDFKRGHIEIDQRSNSLVVTNTKDAIERIRRLIKELDVPLPQVLIDAKIVIAQDSFAKQVGINWQGRMTSLGTGRAGVGAAFNKSTSVTLGNSDSSDGSFQISTPGGDAIGLGLGFQLGAGKHGNLGAALQLAEANGVSKTVASPRIIVNNKSPAKISDGNTVYVSTNAGANATGTLQPVTANLELTVTPQVTNSGSILLDVNMSKDSITSAPGAATPATDTKNISTQVLVDNASTLVLGGVYQFNARKSSGGIPVLKDLPFLGQLFRSDSDSVTKNELMVFITPQIVVPPGYEGESPSAPVAQ